MIHPSPNYLSLEIPRSPRYVHILEAILLFQVRLANGQSKNESGVTSAIENVAIHGCFELELHEIRIPWFSHLNT